MQVGLLFEINKMKVDLSLLKLVYYSLVADKEEDT